MTRDATSLALEYLQSGRVMQIATLQNGRPRVSSVYYVVNLDGKSVYWISEPRRRHSRSLESNSHVGAAIVIRPDLPVVGLQFVGTAAKVTDMDEIQKYTQLYSDKYDGVGGQLYERMVAGTNKNELYKIDIENLEIFDDKNYPGDEVVAVALP